MAQVTIRDLPVGTDPADVDEFVYNDDGVDRRITKEALEDSLDVSNSTATSSTGTSQTVAGALDDRVVRVGSVAGLASVTPTDEMQFSVGEFWPGTGIGGGAFAWDASRNKTQHNGGTVIDPNKLSDLGALGVFGTYFTAAVSGTGCFVRLDKERVDFAEFGAVASLSTNSYEPMQAALDSSLYITNSFDHLCNSNLTGRSSQKISGTGGKIRFAIDIDGLTFTAQSNASIVGLVTESAGVSTTNGSGIVFFNSSKCEVALSKFTGYSNNGVFATGGSTNIKVINNTFEAFTGAIQDSSDIAFYNGAYNCVAKGNTCKGGNWHGIRCQLNSLDHIIKGNYVGEHEAYGILAGYEQVDQESGTVVSDNIVEDIKGSVLIDGDKRAGAGIYGQSALGIKVIGNTVRRCNQETVTEVLAPGAIGISGRCVIANNVIEDTFWYGIANFSEEESSLIIGNTIRDSAKTAIYCKNGVNTTIASNRIQFTTTPQRGIFVRHQTATFEKAVVTGNAVINGSESIGLLNVSDFVIAANQVITATARGINCDVATRGSVSGNTVTDTTGDAFRLNTGSDISITGNTFRGNGTYSIVTTGTVSNVTGEGNALSPNVVAVNPGTYLTINAGAIPVSGTWAPGCKVYYTGPTAGGNIGAVNVTAGSPGTWKEFGAIAA